MFEIPRPVPGLPDPNQVREFQRLGRLTIQEAGQLIRDRLRGDRRLEIATKAAHDFVTDVDRACEKLIVRAIERRFPDHAMVAEESHQNAIQDGFTWIVDPLDGTTNFIHGFPFFAVSMALALNGRIILGWVLDPLRGELFEAAAGAGASLNGRPLRVRSSGSLDDILLATGFPFREKALLAPYLAAFAAVFQRVGGIRRAGAAALDLAYVAAGRVDGFWELGLKPWDVAAGMLLIEEAGGLVTDFRGGDQALTCGHIVAGTPWAQPWLRETVARHMLPHLDPVPGRAVRSQ